MSKRNPSHDDRSKIWYNESDGHEEWSPERQYNLEWMTCKFLKLKKEIDNFTNEVKNMWCALIPNEDKLLRTPSELLVMRIKLNVIVFWTDGSALNHITCFH